MCLSDIIYYVRRCFVRAAGDVEISTHAYLIQFPDSCRERRLTKYDLSFALQVRRIPYGSHFSLPRSHCQSEAYIISRCAYTYMHQSSLLLPSTHAHPTPRSVVSYQRE